MMLLSKKKRRVLVTKCCFLFLTKGE